MVGDDGVLVYDIRWQIADERALAEMWGWTEERVRKKDLHGALPTCLLFFVGTAIENL